MPMYFVRFACPLRVRLINLAQLQGKNRVLSRFTGTASTSFRVYGIHRFPGATERELMADKTKMMSTKSTTAIPTN
jgi:hypothetical protein